MDMTETGVCAFVSSMNACHLEVIDITGLDITNLTISHIASSKYMGNLKKIIANNCKKIDFDCLEILSKSDYVDKLE